MTNRLMRWFEYEHLPPDLQVVSRQFKELATNLDLMPESAEKTAGLRKLLESKDCFVRAALEVRFPADAPAHNPTRAVLDDREQELLNLKGPCSNPHCSLHYAHSGPCNEPIREQAV